MTKKTPAQQMKEIDIAMKKKEMVWKEKESLNATYSTEMEKIQLISDVMTQVRVVDNVQSDTYPYTNLWDEEEVRFFKKNIIKLVKKIADNS